MTASAVTLAASSVAIGLAILSPTFQHLDHHASEFVQRLSTTSGDRAMVAVSFMGKEIVLFLIAVGCSVVLLTKRQARTASFVAATLMSLPLASYLKDVWDRARPNSMDVRVLLASETHSFPSGHTLGATAVYGFFAFLVWKQMRPSTTRTALLIPLLVLPIAIGLSRVYLGVHWFTDIVGGLVFGWLFVVVLIAAYRADLRDEPI